MTTRARMNFFLKQDMQITHADELQIQPVHTFINLVQVAHMHQPLVPRPPLNVGGLYTCRSVESKSNGSDQCFRKGKTCSLTKRDVSTQQPLIPAPQLQIDGGVATRLSHQQQRAKVTADPQRLQLR